MAGEESQILPNSLKISGGEREGESRAVTEEKIGIMGRFHLLSQGKDS